MTMSGSASSGSKMLTLEELKWVVKEHYDPDLLVELLDISSEEIVERFADKIEEFRYKFIDDGEGEEDTDECLQRIEDER